MLIKEEEYRKTKALHYSALKQFDLNRIKFYREYELNQKQAPKLNHAMIVGNIVDCLLLEPEEFDNKFHVASCQKPTGQWGDFIDTLYNVTIRYVNENNEVTETLEARLDLAFSVFRQEFPDKFKGKTLDYIISNFNKKDKNGTSPADYFQECLSSFGKITIDEITLSKADKIVDSVKYGKYTKHLFNYNDDIEVLYQQGVIFNYMGELCKCLHDRIEINHKDKTIRSFDLKSTWDSENFDINFKYLGYYIQGGLYWLSLEQLKIDLGLEDYTIIEEFQFIVCDTSMEFIPHIWIMDKSLIESAINGFKDKYGKPYNGINHIIENIQYCRAIGDFRDSVDLSVNDGKIKIEI